MTKLEVDTGVKNYQAEQIFKRQAAFLIDFQETLLPSSLSSKTPQKSYKHDWRVLMIKIFLETVWILPFGAVVKGQRLSLTVSLNTTFSMCHQKAKKHQFFIFSPLHSVHYLLLSGLVLHYATNYRTKWHPVIGGRSLVVWAATCAATYVGTIVCKCDSSMLMM